MKLSNVFLLQTHWLNGEPISVSLWRQVNTLVGRLLPHVFQTRYHRDFLSHYFRGDHDYTKRLLLKLRQLSDDKIRLNEHDLSYYTWRFQSAIATLSNTYLNKGWEEIYEAIHRLQPNMNYKCTIAYFNPLFNGQMEWLSVPCSTNITLSNIMCQRKPASQQNTIIAGNEVVVYADASYYNYDSWTSNHTHTDSLCPVEVTKRLMNTVISCTGKTINLTQNNNDIPQNASPYFEYANTIVKTICPSLMGKKSQIWIEVCMFKMQNNKQVIQTHAVTVGNWTLLMADRSCPKDTFMISDWCFSLTPNQGKDPLDALTAGDKTIAIMQKLISNYELDNLRVNCSSHCLTTIQSNVVEGNHSCGHLQFQCKDHHCIHDAFVLDQYSDCPDGSDEDIVYINHPLCQYDKRQCIFQMLGVCSNNFYQCLSGECINWHRVCDDNFDCPYGTEEYNCKHMNIKTPIMEAKFKCEKSNEIIPASWVDDLIPDCSNAADEIAYAFQKSSCKSAFQVPCAKYRSICFHITDICVYDHDQYGHLKHCRNGAHLTHCTEVNCPTKFKCTHSYCIPLRKLCDSVVDCPSGEDEWSCGDSLMCPGFFRCKGGVCIHPTEVCDGRNDCPHGEDEMDCNRSECPSECLCFGLVMFCKQFAKTEVELNHYKSVHLMHVASSELPQLVNCSELANITISDSSVNVLKSYTFSGCGNVQFLHFVNTSIRSIQPRAFYGLTSVERLLLDDTLLTVIEPNTFEGMESLSVLSLINLGVEHINSLSFYGLSKLVKLNLSSNFIADFPTDILVYLPQLTDLDISDNPITNVSYVQGNVSNHIRLTVAQPFFCCQTSLFHCHQHFIKSVCTETLTLAVRLFLTTFGIFIIVENLAVLCFLAKTLKGKLHILQLLPLIAFGLDSLQGVYILMATTKDPVFDFKAGSIHFEGGRKHMFCVSAALLQVLSAMTVSAIKGVHTHYFYNQSSLHKSLARSVRLGLKILYHIISIVCVFVLFLTNISHIDASAFCSFLGVTSNWEDWEAGVMIYLVIHGLISNTETIALTSKIALIRIRSHAKILSYGAHISSARVSFKTPLIRTIFRAQVALTVDLAWLVLLAWQYKHGPLHPALVVVMSVIYTVPAASNPIVYLFTGPFFK